MKITIKSITPAQPLDVGDTRFEFRVVLDVGDREETIDLTAEQLTDFRQFQQIALSRTSVLLDLELAESNNEFDRGDMTIEIHNGREGTYSHRVEISTEDDES